MTAHDPSYLRRDAAVACLDAGRVVVHQHQSGHRARQQLDRFPVPTTTPACREGELALAGIWFTALSSTTSTGWYCEP
jgi:hypothetical protein